MGKDIMVETSARHVHVSEADLKTLFGDGAVLTKKKDLSQPGQYACEERVDIVGPKKTIAGVSILGPTRPQTQAEVSISDTRTLGVAAPIRESGDLADSAACKLVGPKGEVELKEGLIVAKRHIHMEPSDADELGVKEKEIVDVRLDTPGRSLTFSDVVVRVNPNFRLAMHIDTDESNAAACAGQVFAHIVKK